MIATVTADGFIGRDHDHSADWSGSEDKKFFKQLTQSAGIIVMGSRTYASIGKPLPGRRNIVYTNHPDKLLGQDVETTSEDPLALINRLESENAKAVAICGGQSVYDMFLQSGCITELYLTISPLLFGTGLSLFKTSTLQKLSLLETQQLGSDSQLLHYHITAG